MTISTRIQLQESSLSISLRNQLQNQNFFLKLSKVRSEYLLIGSCFLRMRCRANILLARIATQTLNLAGGVECHRSVQM
jgi:hypothetical protein